MSQRALILAIALWASSLTAQQVYPLANEELLHSARVWEARDRGDMARLALEKLVAARPDSPQALVELGELQLRMADVSAAQRVLDQLTARFKNAPETRAFATAFRVATRDRLQLASVQRLIQLDRGAEARTALEKLFAEGVPDGMYGIEYYRLLASTPGGWERARNGLRRLVARRPDEPRYRLALARHLLDREASKLEGLQLLHELAQRDDVRPRDVDGELAAAIRSLGYRRAPANVLRAYSSRHPDDANIARLLAQRLQIEAEEQLLLRTAESALNADEQRRNLREVADALLASRASHVSFEHALAVLRELRGAARDGDIRFDAATTAALTWARRSIDSAATNAARASAEKEVAIAFARTSFEATIALAQRLETLGAAGEAQELRATAAQLDPQSSWLFETRVRSMLERGEADAAIGLLETRPVSARWTAAARDELLATALDRRAEAALAMGDTTRAHEDLARAIRLAPTSPWTRYRLAGLVARDGRPDEGRALMGEGAAKAPRDPEMHYAQALFLSSIEDDRTALAVLEAVPGAERSAGMNDLRDRLRVAIARTDARSRHEAGDRAGARAALLEVEPLAASNLDRARELANAWLDLGDAERALHMLDAHRQGDLARNKDVLLAWAEVLNRAEDPRLRATLDELHRYGVLSAEEKISLARLDRAETLRSVRTLERERRFEDAQVKLDALLALSPDDRELRIARAEHEMAAGRPHSARDRYAALVAEDPRDLETRLAYARALTDSDDAQLARLQLQSVIELVPPTDIELQLSIARRQLALGDASAANATAERVLATAPHRADAMVLAGRAKLAERDFAGAREDFIRAQQSPDVTLASAAQAEREAIDARRRHWVETAMESRHKPGEAGVSQFDTWVIPTLWTYGYDYERRLTLRADAVSVSAGSLSSDFDTAALLGTVQAAGASAPRRYRNDTQEGLSLGLSYSTDAFAADLGTTPLGFLVQNVVGGFEWTPEWRGIDFGFGIERRALTSSVLSYAGMRDPITGRRWGGAIETGPYVEAGVYRERSSLAASLRYTQIEGENVVDNGFLGARVAADRKLFSRAQLQVFVGAVVNYWAYERNAQNYTFGNGGYYSPDSYVSIAIPIEAQGVWRGWSYRARASLTYSRSDIARAPFYPTDAALQAAAANAPLPSGFDSPFHTNAGSSGTSLSAYAAVERRLLPGLVMGAKLDIDRADYYEPTTVMLYVRHTFGAASTPIEIPPRPVRAYND